MITFKYDKAWSRALRQMTLNNHSNANIGQFYENQKDALTPLNAIKQLLSTQSTTKKHVPKLLKVILQYIINTYDAENILAGLLCYVNNNRISPFSATRDYCIKVISCDEQGNVKMNISPIYHLGPEYPEYYEQKEGKALSKDAIIGLVESDTQKPNDESHTRFNLGIDAGIAFSDAKIAHNKTLQLKMNVVAEGVMAELQCESQSTSRLFTWEMLGMSSTPCYDVYDNERVQHIWAA